MRLETKLLAGFLCACLLPGGVILLFFWQSQQLLEENQSLSRTQEAIGLLEQAMSLVTDAETGQRGYVITGDTDYLRPYHKAFEEADPVLNRLQVAVRGNPGQMARLSRLEVMVHARLDRIKAIVDLRRDLGFQAAQTTILDGKGKEQMEELRKLVDQMQASERRPIFSHTKTALEGSRNARFLMLASLLLQILFSAFTFLAIRKEVRARRKAEEETAAARDAALDATRLKSEFLANMSHEIRTPMNGVIGLTNLLLDTSLDKRQRGYAESIRASGESLLTIINDILDFSKIEAGKLHFESIDFDLRETVENCVEQLAPQASAKKLELACLIEPEVPAQLRGDPGRLCQVLTNLLNNAIKFTQKGEVFLRVDLAEKSSSEAALKFEVKDTGIGIPETIQKKLFQPFSQADGSTTRRFGGTGLGLAIARELVRQMGGEIGLHSIEGRGSTFWFTAHFGKAQPKAHESAPIHLDHQAALIVDDNEANRLVLEHQLQAWKIPSQKAASPAEALEILRQRASEGDPFGLAILDMQMPEMNGLDLAKKIKADSRIASVRLVLLTSLGEMVPEARLHEHGIEACLFKPIRTSRLYDAIVHAFAKNASDSTPKRADSMSSDTPKPHQEEFTLLHRRVLVAEDNLVNQQVLLEQLERFGCNADLAKTGRAALELVKQGRYDLIFMDGQMPEMDGYEAARAIRQWEQTLGPNRPPTYIIAVTANAMQGDREKCLEAGMDDYIAKPVRMPELRACIQRAVATLPGQAGKMSAILPAPPSSLKEESQEKAPEDRGRPSIDFAELNLLAGGEPERLRQLYDIYTQQTDEIVSELRAAVKIGDWVRVKNTAHKGVGSSSTCGLPRITVLFQQMERKAGQGMNEENLDLLQQIEQEYATIQKLWRSSLNTD